MDIGKESEYLKYVARKINDVDFLLKSTLSDISVANHLLLQKRKGMLYAIDISMKIIIKKHC